MHVVYFPGISINAKFKKILLSRKVKERIFTGRDKMSAIKAQREEK
jgi:hypothetical protein